ncbi:MAG: hypothetical protein HGB04_00975 [Chlorobiaceae bacterium]|nr:hypothetical protein [Chlorobiaceae bacterium]
MDSTVLITTASNPPEGVPYLKMTDGAARRVAAKASVYFWAAQKIRRIVIADATGSVLLSRDELSDLALMNVEVEQLCYRQNDHLVTQKGKGYGEGALIGFALNDSVLLRADEGFFKCTGKFYCRNFPDIFRMIQQNRFSSIFWRYYRSDLFFGPWADTRFYYTTRDFAVNHLIPAYVQTDERKEIMCEQTVFDLLNHTMETAMALKPRLTGFAGGSGELSSDVTLGELDSTYPCWVRFR